MFVHVINPDKIQAGDQVTLSYLGGLPAKYTVAERRGTSLLVEAYGSIKRVEIAGRRTTYQLIDHQPWMP